MWQLTMYCHSRLPDAMHANLKSFGASRHHGLNFDGFICIRFAAPLYSAGIVILASVYMGG